MQLWVAGWVPGAVLSCPSEPSPMPLDGQHPDPVAGRMGSLEKSDLRRPRGEGERRVAQLVGGGVSTGGREWVAPARLLCCLSGLRDGLCSPSPVGDPGPWQEIGEGRGEGRVCVPSPDNSPSCGLSSGSRLPRAALRLVQRLSKWTLGTFAGPPDGHRELHTRRPGDTGWTASLRQVDPPRTPGHQEGHDRATRGQRRNRVCTCEHLPPPQWACFSTQPHPQKHPSPPTVHFLPSPSARVGCSGQAPWHRTPCRLLPR